jgi:hypothetical protein
MWVEMPLLDALQKIDKDLGGTSDYVRYRPATKNLLVATSSTAPASTSKWSTTSS